MRPLRLLFGCCIALLLATAAAQDLAPIPPLKARVTDLAGMLKPEQQADLERKLQAHEAKTGNQVAILLVKSTAPEVIEQYGIRVAENWKIGRKGVDDGVILIIAKDNPRDLRRMRLEVGRGAEGTIPDARAKQILQDIIAPNFRSNDFHGGLNAGIDAIHALLNKEAFPAPPKQAARNSQNTADSPIWLAILVALFPILIFASIIVAIVRATKAAGHNGWGNSSSGIFIGGGSGSSGWSSSDSSSGSDFSGGGGDFGGGGASGDW